ncbi:Hypothetical predicted protein, partial [Paramuricea clavata]
SERETALWILRTLRNNQIPHCKVCIPSDREMRSVCFTVDELALAYRRRNASDFADRRVMRGLHPKKNYDTLPLIPHDCGTMLRSGALDLTTSTTTATRSDHDNNNYEVQVATGIEGLCVVLRRFPTLVEFANAIHNHGAALTNCWGFVDGTVRPIARPDQHQRTVYNGHKRVHAIKFQSVVPHNGLITNLYGP